MPTDGRSWRRPTSVRNGCARGDAKHARTLTSTRTDKQTDRQTSVPTTRRHWSKEGRDCCMPRVTSVAHCRSGQCPAGRRRTAVTARRCHHIALSPAGSWPDLPSLCRRFTLISATYTMTIISVCLARFIRVLCKRVKPNTTPSVYSTCGTLVLLRILRRLIALQKCRLCAVSTSSVIVIMKMMISFDDLLHKVPAVFQVTFRKT